MSIDVFSARMDRLLQAIGGGTDTSLAQVLGIKPPSIAGARKRKLIPGEWIEKIALGYNIPADWLLFGRGPMRYEESAQAPLQAQTSQNAKDRLLEINAASLDNERRCDVDLVMVPMAEARLSAGTGSLETGGEIERTYAFRSDFLRRKGNPDKMVLMRVGGDSMQPEIMDNDVVLLDQGKRDLRPGPIFAVGFEDAIYLKRIDKLPGKIILKSANPAYPPVELDIGEQEGDSFRVIGQVIWSGREY